MGEQRGVGGAVASGFFQGPRPARGGSVCFLPWGSFLPARTVPRFPQV